MHKEFLCQRRESIPVSRKILRLLDIHGRCGKAASVRSRVTDEELEQVGDGRVQLQQRVQGRILILFFSARFDNDG